MYGKIPPMQVPSVKPAPAGMAAPPRAMPAMQPQMRPQMARPQMYAAALRGMPVR